MKLPTDSLYKFLATFGIILFLGSAWLQYKISENTMTFFNETQLGIKQISDSQKMFAENNEKFISSINKINGSRDDNALRDAESVLQEMKRQSSDDVAFQGLIKERMTFLMERDNLVSKFLMTTSFIGILMSICGIFAWYTRLQVFVDQKIKLDDFSIALSSSDLEAKSE